MAVGGDRVAHALWRCSEGGVLEAIGAVRAQKTLVYVLLGLNDVLSRRQVSNDVIGGLHSLVGQLKGLSEELTTIIEVPMLPMFSAGMREEALRINAALIQLSGAGFRLQSWDPCLLDATGTFRPRWLISRHDVHLNERGNDRFARLLASLISQGDLKIQFGVISALLWYHS